MARKYTLNLQLEGELSIYNETEIRMQFKYLSQ